VQNSDFWRDFGPTADQETQVVLSLSDTCRLVVKYGNIVRQQVKGIIVPNNTAIGAPGGAGAAVMYAVDQVRLQQNSSTKKNVYDILFPSLHIQNPMLLQPDEVVLDLEDRPRVGPLGAAAISRSLKDSGLLLHQGWEHIIFALIRHQGSDVTDNSIRSATANSITAAERAKLGSVAMVPFGTGLFPISVSRAASLMIPVIADRCHRPNQHVLKELIVVMNEKTQFEEFRKIAISQLR